MSNEPKVYINHAKNGDTYTINTGSWTTNSGITIDTYKTSQSLRIGDQEISEDTIKELLELNDRIKEVEETFKILRDAKPENVKALAEAYDHYKFIKALCKDDSNEGE